MLYIIFYYIKFIFIFRTVQSVFTLLNKVFNCNKQYKIIKDEVNERIPFVISSSHPL